MPILPIVTVPAEILGKKTTPVTSFDSKLHTLLDSMRQTMYFAHGIGLAAPQIDQSIRVAVVDVSEDKTAPLEFVNPIITQQEGSVESEEGCLSIPEYRETIERFETITVSYQDRSGKKQEMKADGLLSICLQHEIDHLDGILFVDHLSRLKKQIYRRWLAKSLEQKDEE